MCTHARSARAPRGESSSWPWSCCALASLPTGRGQAIDPTSWGPAACQSRPLRPTAGCTSSARRCLNNGCLPARLQALWLRCRRTWTLHRWQLCLCCAGAQPGTLLSTLLGSRVFGRALGALLLSLLAASSLRGPVCPWTVSRGALFRRPVCWTVLWGSVQAQG